MHRPMDCGVPEQGDIAAEVSVAGTQPWDSEWGVGPGRVCSQEAGNHCCLPLVQRVTTASLSSAACDPYLLQCQ